jgi:hypothetical protein
MNLRDGKYWDKQLEKDLPDCRLSHGTRSRKLVQRGRMTFEVAYCANCGKEDGLITADWSAHVFLICNDCVTIMGVPPGVAQVPDEVVKGGC